MTHAPATLRAAWRAVAAAAVMLLSACSAVKHVPDGSFLVEDVKITVIDTVGQTPPPPRPADLTPYLRQTPNHKVLGNLRLQLATYNLSGRDSTRWYNRWLRRMGQAPVIWSPSLTDLSASQLRQAMVNRGYLDAAVTADTAAQPERKRIRVNYTINPGTPRRISAFDVELADSAMAAVLMPLVEAEAPEPGDLLDRDMLDELRAKATSALRRHGYFTFTKDRVAFYADTVAGSPDVALTMTVRPATGLPAIKGPEPIYHIGRVVYLTNYDLGKTLRQTLAEATDSTAWRGVVVLYGPDRWIAPQTLEEKTFIRPGSTYDAAEVDLTYEFLSRLGMVKSINIEMLPGGTAPDGSPLVDAYILLSRNRKQQITADLEGTNSEGDLGFGIGLTYQHRNLAHRSRLLTVKFRAGYESLSGDLSGLVNNNYQEYSGEVGVTFPRFAMPFISSRLRRRMRANTEVVTTFNYQARPEYTRIMAGAAWRYKWSSRSNLSRRALDLININYVYLPKSTDDFLNQIAPDNPLLRYSYEDHFIMNLGYSYYHTNRRLDPGPTSRRAYLQPVITTFRFSAEEAGSLLYAISNAIGQQRSDGVYKILGIQYAQYCKAEAEYSWVRNFTPRHSLALRAGLGIAVPYGNSRAVPFEKRFYAGGANNVRGWSVRTLGPGAFDGTNSVTDFINQCGDISLILSAEYRARLFWVVEGALFIDAGNIWTIHNYPNQPGGFFRWRDFYKQIAAAYGVGLRFDFTYFLLRLDLGMKAHNPAAGRESWPIFHPRWRRDHTIHFAVGYPF